MSYSIPGYSRKGCSAGNRAQTHSATAANKELGAVPNLGYFITASLNVPIWDWGVRRSDAELPRECCRVVLVGGGVYHYDLLCVIDANVYPRS